MADLDELLRSAESVAITLRYGDVTVEVTPESVIFRDPEKRDSEDNMLTSFSHENFDDIIRAYNVMAEAAA